MKSIPRYLLFIPVVTVLFFACNNGGHYNKEMKSDNKDQAKLTEPPAATGGLSSSAAVEKGKDPDRKFIRTADIKFRVKDVTKATYAIEDITSKFGGFVTSTQLQSVVDSKTNIPVSADSTLETTYFTVEDNMTIRVPNTKMDTTLKCIAKLVSFLDSRVIKANDIGLQLLANELTQKRAAKNEKKSAVTGGNTYSQTIVFEDHATSPGTTDEDGDNAKINNLSLMDQVKFSTINLSIYQRQSIKRELLQNESNIKAYEPGIGFRLWESIKIGWDGLESLLVFLVRLWWFFILVASGYLLFRKFRIKTK